MVHIFGYALGEFGATEQQIKDAVAREFQDDRIFEYKVLAVWSSEPDYSMSCWMLLEKDGTMYEVTGGHCSCAGYEEQFSPAECPAEYLTSSKSSWELDRVKESSSELWASLLHSLGLQPRMEA